MSTTPQQEKRWLRWGPIDATLISLSYPMNILRVMWGVYQIDWPDGYILGNGKQWMWIQTMDELEHAGWSTFNNWMLVPEKRLLVRSNYEQHVKKLHARSAQILHNEQVQWSNQELLNWFEEWNNAFITFWAHASLPELVTWGAEAAIRKEIQIYGDKRTEIEIMEALTAPTSLSFFQHATLDLLRRVQHAQTPTERSTAINEHLKQYYWIDNSYAQAHRRTAEDAETFVQHSIEEYGSVTEALQSLETYTQRVDQKRHDVQHKYHLSDILMRWSRAHGDAISWQDERKGEQWRQHDILFTMITECSKRFGIPKEDAYWLSGTELISHCKKGTNVADSIQCRKVAVAHLLSKQGSRTSCGEEAKEVITKLWERPVTDHSLQGQVASFGKQKETSVTGRVCIVLSPQDANHFQNGDILVARMTSPDFMPIMRKASAVITDEGGLTAHAAVVSRELGIPCIVASKYATKVLNNGDHVTLDIQTGTIQKQVSS